MKIISSVLSSFFISLSILSTPLPLQADQINETVELAVDFMAPSQRYLTTHPLSNIKPHFKSYGVTSQHVEVFQKAIAEETYGFFGYHGMRREFMIYQDIIRVALEEILGIPIRPDFHFLRMPGDPNLNIDSAYAFIKKHPYDVNDDLPSESQHILSMNMSLYEHYWDPGQCSVYYFAKNINFGMFNYEKKLIPFFHLLGIDPVYIHEAFEIGRSMLVNEGVLLQFFDHSNYELADKQAYLSYPSGRIYHPQQPISHLILDKNRSNFPQFRLLMNNMYTLNPNSSLVIKRHHLTPEAVYETFEENLRAYFQTLPVDVMQKEAYRESLLSMWESALIKG